MLLPFVFALAVPISFVRAVEARMADAQMHVVDWWADDLDGDHVLESIAIVCSDEVGFFLVQHGKNLLEASMTIDGRNTCPEARTPVWRIARSGVITENVDVHHGLVGHALAVRKGRLVLVRRDTSRWDVGRDGTTREESHANYDLLRWRDSFQLPDEHATQAAGPLVLITDRVRRPSRLMGRSTLAATIGEGATTLHVHADRAVVIRDCTDTPCKTTDVARGDTKVEITAATTLAELEIVVGNAKLRVHFERLEAAESYPQPVPY